MARGRLISRSLGTSRKFAALAVNCNGLAEFAQALYPLVVVNTDDYGRMHGDAFTVKHVVWPTSHRSELEFDAALNAMEAASLIARYTVNDTIYLQVQNFEEHQPGLHKRTKSRFPEVPGNSRKPPEIPSEEKGTEEKRSTPLTPLAGGLRKPTKRELEKASAYRTNVHAMRCPHQPECLTVRECVHLVALTLRGH